MLDNKSALVTPTPRIQNLRESHDSCSVFMLRVRATNNLLLIREVRE